MYRRYIKTIVTLKGVRQPNVESEVSSLCFARGSVSRGHRLTLLAIQASGRKLAVSSALPNLPARCILSLEAASRWGSFSTRRKTKNETQEHVEQFNHAGYSVNVTLRARDSNSVCSLIYGPSSSSPPTNAAAAASLARHTTATHWLEGCMAAGGWRIVQPKRHVIVLSSARDT